MSNIDREIAALRRISDFHKLEEPPIPEAEKYEIGQNLKYLFWAYDADEKHVYCENYLSAIKFYSQHGPVRAIPMTTIKGAGYHQCLVEVDRDFELPRLPMYHNGKYVQVKGWGIYRFGKCAHSFEKSAIWIHDLPEGERRRVSYEAGNWYV